MSIRGARDLSVPVVLALLGALICAGSLLMNWVTFDLAQLERWVQTSPLLADARAASNMTPEQLHAALQLGLNAATERFGGELTGLKVLRVTSVVAQLVAVAFVFAAVARFTNQNGSRSRLASELAVGGGLLLFRPVWSATHLPGDQIEAFFGGPLLEPGLGIHVAIVGAVLILMAAAGVQRSAMAGTDAAERAEQDQAEFAARTLGGVPSPAGAVVQVRPYEAQSNYAPPAQTYLPAQPYAAPMQPAPAYPAPPAQPYPAPAEPPSGGQGYAPGSVPPPGLGA
jgi:hypothetical protein